MLSRPVAWSVALAATLTMTVSYIDRQTLAALAPTVTRELDISQTAYGWLSSAFSIAYLLATPLAGWWIDRVGARRGLLISVVVWSTVAALHAIVPGFGVLFALRILLGIAEAPSFPGAAQTVQRALPPEDRPRGFGVLFTGSSIGGLIAPPLASLLFAHFGWRTAFLVSALVGLIWIPLWIALTFRREVRAQLDLAAERTASTLSFGALLATPVMKRAVLATVCFAPIVGFVLLWSAKILAEVHRVPQEEIGRYAWLPLLIFDLGAIGFGDLASRLRGRDAGVRALYAVGMVLSTALALLPLATGPWMATVIMGVAVAGTGALYTITASDLLGRVPPASVSLASGVLAGAQSLAYIVMNPLVGASVDYTGSYTAASIFIGLWVVPGALLWIVWKPASIRAPAP